MIELRIEIFGKKAAYLNLKTYSVGQCPMFNHHHYPKIRIQNNKLNKLECHYILCDR